ncbi:MAG: hypothetical protein ABJF10_26710 [Chthoniobacter sp.]|uniref:hypothetical protein n=1 Tax=Chthoniobacter sp. TaxID=2510640 RepID=UPI0032A99C59
MITLQSDQLLFRFPEVEEALRRFIEEHIQRTVPQMLAEDREKVITKLETQSPLRYVADSTRQQASDTIRKATAETIATALRFKCRGYPGMEPKPGRSTLKVEFQRTLRIPDDGRDYPLPAGLGRFPLQHVDDFPNKVPEAWLKHGGVMMPMHQSEALWLRFDGQYPCAVKVAAGKINAVTGEGWTAELRREPQNYLVMPLQRWLDGFAVSKGIIRQFVAMPLGGGYSVEEQLTGQADVGGIQIQVFPLKSEVYFHQHMAGKLPTKLEDLLEELVGPMPQMATRFCAEPRLPMTEIYSDMGLGAGGMMRQEVFKDRRDFADWDTSLPSRCFVHLCNSQVWRQITGSNPPHPPLTAREYSRQGIPWFDYYRDDLGAVSGSEVLAGVKSVLEMGKAKQTAPLPDNASVTPEVIVQYGNARRPDEVREWQGS